jgi:hypothetical protein
VPATSFGVFALLPPCCFQHSRAYNYTLAYPTVLTIVHSDGTYILSHDTRDDMSAIATEKMVHRMNLNEDWCRDHMSPERYQELNFALKLTAARNSCNPTNLVTGFIAFEEAHRLLRILGRK